MAQLNNLKRIVKEDFQNQDQNFIDSLGSIFNPFIDQVTSAFNKGINFDNLSRQVITVNVENGTGGKLKTTTQFKYTLTNKPVGLNIINAVNQTNSATYPTTAPWISWSIASSTSTGGIITINQATGIQDNNQYTFTIELIS